MTTHTRAASSAWDRRLRKNAIASAPTKMRAMIFIASEDRSTGSRAASVPSRCIASANMTAARIASINQRKRRRTAYPSGDISGCGATSGKHVQSLRQLCHDADALLRCVAKPCLDLCEAAPASDAERRDWVDDTYLAAWTLDVSHGSFR